MVEQPSSPHHPFASPDFALPVLSPSTSAQMLSPTLDATPETMPGNQEQEDSSPDQSSRPASTRSTAVVEEGVIDANDGDDSSNSESNSESSTSTETPGTISTPRSSAQDSQPIPESSTSQLSALTPEEATPATQDVASTATEENASVPPNDAPAAHPPPPIDVDIPVVDTTPDWVKYEEDTSVPDADEMKEIEANKSEFDAADICAVEKDVFSDLDDPDLRPCKKIRLSWVVKGVRGTKERPNRARIMTSPSVYVDGKYWNIKFFPRGNKSRNSLAVFVRCSPLEPGPVDPELEGTFKCYQCPPESDLSKAEPFLDLELAGSGISKGSSSSNDNLTSSRTSETETKPESLRDPEDEDEDDEDDDSVSGDEDDRVRDPMKQVVAEDFRVSAQLGLVIYNPAESRTCYTSEASHQFYPHQDDWGWDPAVSQYEEIHRRKRGQRQALLRNDTLAIDAYIRIYDDPTKALFWHASSGEAQWDSKGLAGFFPMGTKLLYHSPATAGISAYMLLAPFRKAIQQVDAGAWRRDSSVRPRPLIAHLQLVLFQMRHMKKEELYVHLDNAIHEITRSGETFENVNTFWETFRRAIEIEADGDNALISSLQEIFGARDLVRQLPNLPVKNVSDFQDAANQAFEKAGIKRSLPNFLPLTLQRQSFDSEKRQWRLHNNRVRISEEIDLSRFSTDKDAKYTLYGLVIHDGDRTSAKFFSILRPNGPGGKWLAFSDGNGNKIFSYTKKRVTEYEGLDLPELKKSTSPRQTLHTAMYIRTSCMKDYLPSAMEPFRLPVWLKPHLDESYNRNPDIFEDAPNVDQQAPVTIEIFWDKIVGGQEGKLDLYKLKSDPRARDEGCRQTLTADRDATISEVQALIASQLKVDERAFRLWGMNYNRLGGVSKGYMCVLRSVSMVGSCLGTSEILTLWLTMIPGKYDIDDEALSTNFRSIGGVHVKATPTPVTPAESPRLSASTQRVSSNESAQPAEPVIERGSAAEMDLAAGPVETLAAPDAEQESIRQAVEETVQNAASDTAVEISEGDSNVIATQPQGLSVPTMTNEQTSQDITADALAPAPAPAGATATAIVESFVPSEPSTVQDHSSEESARDAPAPEPDHPERPTDSHADPTSAPPVHGHLFEASTNGESPLPIGIPIAIGNDRIVIVSANQDEISAEDAELIGSMIAADLEAAERERRALNADSERNADGNDTVDIDSRPSTPRQRVPDIYGFLHVFNADKQEFTAHSAFTAPGDMTISAMVRKQLQYDDERSFHLWKRDGTYRTTGVSLESTFMDVSLSDCCEVIVGDHLGEKKMEALKAEAKYVDPGQLMRYLAMVQRGHPVLARTSAEAVEIAEFGGDYYKGPLVRGQRHGQQCHVITQSGDAYEGPLVAGRKSGGKGKMTYQNGDVYEGGWLDDQKHGQGEFVEKRTGNRYVGGYENDKRWGKGTTYWEVADQQAALCQVCYFEEVDALFYRCGHVVACYPCAKQCVSESNGCPVCRKPIEAVVKMYRS